MKEFGIHFGALTPKLSEQLREQGFEDSKIEVHEKILMSIYMLRIWGYLPDSQVDRMYKKFMKDIDKFLKPIEGESHD